MNWKNWDTFNFQFPITFCQERQRGIKALWKGVPSTKSAWTGFLMKQQDQPIVRETEERALGREGRGAQTCRCACPGLCIYHPRRSWRIHPWLLSLLTPSSPCFNRHLPKMEGANEDDLGAGESKDEWSGAEYKSPPAQKVQPLFSSSQPLPLENIWSGLPDVSSFGRSWNSWFVGQIPQLSIVVHLLKRLHRGYLG